MSPPASFAALSKIQLPLGTARFIEMIPIIASIRTHDDIVESCATSRQGKRTGAPGSGESFLLASTPNSDAGTSTRAVSAAA